MAFKLPHLTKNKEAGFTLFEVLAAFVLFSLFLSRLVPALVQLRESQLLTARKTEAYLLGYGKLQEVLCQAERRQEGRWANLRTDYTWRFEEEKGDAFLAQTLTVKWKVFGDERKIQLRKVQLKTD